MRDTVRLRSRLALLACLPALASGVACQDPPGAQAKAQTKSKPEGAGRPKPVKARAPAKTESRNNAAAPGRSSPPPVNPEQARFMPIPGDPPYIDGYNPEEQMCPSGNWCGTIETASPLAPHPEHTPKTFGCPERIVGAHKPSPIEGPAYEGLSDKGTMQGTLNKHRVGKERAKGNENICCYHWFEYCSGRPLRDNDDRLVAEIGPGRAWSMRRILHAGSKPLDPPTRQALAQVWLDDALAEHASVAAFARVTLELMAHGAPPEILAGTQAAALDEIEHARRCFSLAGRYGGAPVAPGAIATPPPRVGGLDRLAVDTFLEGCVGETIAALVAERALAGATDPEVRETLALIAEDESRHAALAWRTLAWALEEGGEPVGRALARACTEAVPAPPSTASSPAMDLAAWAAHGRLDPAATTEAARDAWSDVIAPMLRQLLQPTATGDRATA